MLLLMLLFHCRLLPQAGPLQQQCQQQQQQQQQGQSLPSAV
jgi:hypothetical protein